MTCGSTAVAFDVLNAYGLETVEAALAVTEPDPGWMSGYLFELGQTSLRASQGGRPARRAELLLPLRSHHTNDVGRREPVDA